MVMDYFINVVVLPTVLNVYFSFVKKISGRSSVINFRARDLSKVMSLDNGVKIRKI